VQLAQLNIVQALYRTDNSRMEGFTSQIDTINALTRARVKINFLTEDYA